MSSNRRRSWMRTVKISPPIEPTSSYKCNVFLSFRGPDARHTLVDYLYESLVDAGISVFRDNEELTVGRSVGPELKRDIDDSSIYEPILSEGYMCSAWCLQEIVHMAKCHGESTGQEIVPIFYGVSPSDARLWSGSYGQALLKHKGCYGEGTVQEWRETLMEVGNLSGLDARTAP